MKTKCLSGCVLLFCCLSPGLRAQDTDFWFAAPHMTEELDGGYTSHYPAFLAISNNSNQNALIEIRLYNGGAMQTIVQTIAPGALYKHDFDTDAKIKTIQNPRDSAGKVTTRGVHITSDVGVTAYYMMNGVGSKDIFTLKGRQALGNLFYAPMQSDNLSQTIKGGAYDQIDIVATEDNTVIEVTPKAAFRIAPSASSPANATYTYTLHKGQTLKIMEHAQNSLPSLAGTKIEVLSANTPIAVTVTEDWVRGDTSGDQVVPVGSLGTHYVVPRGYMAEARADQERFYLGATTPNTTVQIYDDPANAGVYTPMTLNKADTAYKYTFPAPSTNINAVYVVAEHPVYIYQRTGNVEEGAALLPSLYAIRQTRLSYYQISSAKRRAFLVFRNGKESGFTISYGAVEKAPLQVGALYPIPNVADWKVARFDLPSAADNQVVTIENTQSAFSFGYITGSDGDGNNSYGYFSAFGTFEFPPITYMCGSSVILQGGYARSYEWSFGGNVISADTFIVATQEGEYTLVMDQDPDIVTAKTTVLKVNAGAISPAGQVICPNEIPPTPLLTVAGALEPPETTYQWQISHDNETWTNIPSATSPAYTIPGPLNQTTWYRRGMSSDICGTAYTYAAQVRVSSCTLPVNPHLMIRMNKGQ